MCQNRFIPCHTIAVLMFLATHEPGDNEAGAREGFNVRNCPRCGSILAPGFGVCIDCGEIVTQQEETSVESVGQWLQYLGADSGDEMLKGLIGNDEGGEDGSREACTKKLAAIRHLVTEGMKRAEEYPTIPDLLEEADVYIKAGNIEKVEDIFTCCRKELNRASLHYKVLVDNLRAAKKAMEQAYELGGDLSEAQRYEKMCTKAMERFDYEKAIAYAIRSTASARKAQSQYDSWKAEIGDFLGDGRKTY